LAAPYQEKVLKGVRERGKGIAPRGKEYFEVPRALPWALIKRPFRAE